MRKTQKDQADLCSRTCSSTS